MKQEVPRMPTPPTADVYSTNGQPSASVINELISHQNSTYENEQIKLRNNPDFGMV